MNHSILLFIAISIKVIILLSLGPLQQADSGVYITFSDLILNGSEWSRHVDLYSTHITTFRMIGYPAVIALFHYLFGTYWNWALVIFQSAVGLFAVALVFRAGWLLTGSDRLGSVAAGLYLVSPALQMDSFILTDSLYGHILAILTALLVIWIKKGQQATIARVLCCGLLLVFAMLIRSATMPLGLLFVAPFVVWIWSSGLKTGVLMLALFLAPLVMLDYGYKAWNKARTGEAFLTTDVTFALLQPLIALETRGTPIFSGQTILDRSAHEVFASEQGSAKRNMVIDAFAIGNRLINPQALSGVEALSLVKARFFQTMLTAPGAVFAHTIREMSSSVLFSPFDPLRVLRRLISYRYDLDFLDARHSFLSRPVADWSMIGVVYLLLEGISRLMALTLLLGFLAGMPASIRPMIQGNTDAGLRVTLAVLALGFIVVTAMVHLEERYIIGIFPALFFVSLVTLKESYRNLSHWTFLRNRSPKP